MRIDRCYEPSGLNERLGLCLRQRLHSRRGFDPTLRLADKLGESGCDFGKLLYEVRRIGAYV
jgi:hypothetical protein